jgi:hypothetical protein
VVITKDAKFRVFSPPALQFLHCQINIVLSIDGVHTLTNIVITNPIRVDLVSQVVLFHGIVTTVMVYAKDGLYHDQFPIDMFFPLVVKVFGCVHQHAKGFLYQCANMT